MEFMAKIMAEPLPHFELRLGDTCDVFAGRLSKWL
jgi:hypothetical protein